MKKEELINGTLIVIISIATLAILVGPEVVASFVLSYLPDNQAEQK